MKAIADSLNGIAYKDDAQIVEVVSKKFYSERPRVEVTIEDLA
ncbi:RusA family crossover junction endodeoxyribonuclease [Paraclostridium bifermentans]|nr:RusA family crossover junction endodeoxyribonuclease [Paraclostridium bifermentans]